MSWDCPFCERKYPDSGIGLPSSKDADEKTHCDLCSVDPNAVQGLVEEWREVYIESDNDPSQIVNGGHQMMCKQINECADELEALIGDDE